jgi:hypothetical protein
LEVAFEEGAGVLEVLSGVGFCGGDALKRFVEDADDAVLFGERGERKFKTQHLIHIGAWHTRAGACGVDAFTRFVSEKPI